MERKNLFTIITSVLAYWLTSTPTVADTGTGKMAFNIDGIESLSGTVYCRLYKDEQGFPADGEFAIAELLVKPIPGQTSCVFEEIEKGTYAFSVWHDVDDDGELDSNFVGVPKEPVGASNNAKGRFGPPKFQKAAVELSESTFEQSVTIE